MKEIPTRLKIGQFADRAGVGIDTVRFYERAGLMPQALRTASGYRTYGEDEVRRLQFIRRSKALGFTLDEIAELLKLSAARNDRSRVKTVAERRLADLEQRIRELTAIRDTLAHYTRQCSGHGAIHGCPIIEAITGAPPLSEEPHHDTRHASPRPRSRVL